MWPYHPDLLATPVPRYTSFPTAAEFSNAVGADDANRALRSVSGDASLYVHIPFCEQICWYCGCNTGAANKAQRLHAYLDALHREIAITGARLDGRTTIKRIAFGGGSPNAIAPTDFVRLVDALTLHLSLDQPVWSIELDPRTLAAEWGPVLGGIGVSHASMGVQTFEPALQAAIGRVQPDSLIVTATDLLRKAGVSSLNYDLMYGLPGQTMDHLEATLARTIELGADRIALFGYAHVPHMLPRQRRIDASALPGQEARFAMAQYGYDRLTAAGYVAIGFDHFALPGDPMAIAAREKRVRRNFQGFTDDQAPSLIGLGASSISCFDDLLVQNEKNAGRYRMLLSQDLLPAQHGVHRDADDRLRGAVISELLCQGEVAVPPALLAEVAGRITPFVERGVAVLDGSTLRIPPAGLPYARTVAALFDPYRQDSLRRFSSAV
ncbi:oxygen-independent coproporphyrinogen III oxidase [Novosphingobium sp. B 225]|uniref:oxygen-independent coproporphyrinogen III oxidase n=1 Tax=Novosphingobium sp. B 225 TaxID=1961849 RepID=UPI000B4A83DE|nr:oxygen-independent coproporphyrinogen III oxidase [Novosphingobium sp. B 225]